MSELKRIDLPICRCPDCGSGYSIPLGQAKTEHIRALIEGRLTDATGVEFRVSRRRVFSDGRFSPETDVFVQAGGAAVFRDVPVSWNWTEYA